MDEMKNNAAAADIEEVDLIIEQVAHIIVPWFEGKIDSGEAHSQYIEKFKPADDKESIIVKLIFGHITRMLKARDAEVVEDKDAEDFVCRHIAFLADVAMGNFSELNETLL